MDVKREPASPEFVAWFKEHVGLLVTKAREIVKSGEQHCPALFVYPNDINESVAIIPVGQFFSGSTVGKDISAMLHQEIAQDTMVRCVIAVNETWVLGGKLGELKDVDFSKGIEEHPQRREAITFNAIQKGMQLIASYMIKRNPDDLEEEPYNIVDPIAGILEGHGKGEGITASHGRMII